MAISTQATNGKWEDESQSIVIRPSASGFPVLSFQTIRLSCESHPYSSGRSYAGFILYGLQSDGEVLEEWWLNGKHCKNAYLVIQDTDSEAVKRYMAAGAPGMVHGAVYWNVFGEGADVTKAIGEGFSLLNGAYKWNSYTFNANSDTYHDGQRVISSQMKECVGKILDDWRCNSSLGKTYRVKELLKPIAIKIWRGIASLFGVTSMTCQVFS